MNSTLPCAAGDGAIIVGEVFRLILALALLGTFIWLVREALEWRRRRPVVLAMLERLYAEGAINRAEFFMRRGDILPSPATPLAGTAPSPLQSVPVAPPPPPPA